MYIMYCTCVIIVHGFNQTSSHGHDSSLEGAAELNYYT